ncbi:TVP38/TMEM64 family protein [Limosilactobacillus mucosae]|uniref:TVP38/TMEM64 family protein n=1 Tax=Limosilactobacillus mucosae TaxID=97478 RepID=UPI0039963C75
MPQKLHLNSRWLTILAGIFAIIVLLKVGFDYWPEIKLLMHPTHEHRVMLTEMIRDHGAKDFLLLMMVIALFNAIPGMSIAAVCILAGVCYGPWIGLLISWSGNILGNLAVVLLFSRVNLSQIKKHQLLQKLLDQPHPRLGLIIGYMIPAIPNALVNYSGIRLNVSLTQMLPLIALGMLPCSFIYAFGGNAIFSENLAQLVIFAVLVIILALVSIIAHQHHKHANRRIKEKQLSE